MSNTAERIIEKCGGAAAVAEMLGVHITNVHRWTYSKDQRGGTGGRIPARHHERLLHIAESRGITLAPADFFDVSRGGPADSQVVPPC